MNSPTIFLNKFILMLLFLVVLGQTSPAQFTDKFSLGVSGGVNVTLPFASGDFSVFTQSDLPNGVAKEYGLFIKNIAPQYHFLFYYRIGNQKHIGILPGWYNYSYRYETVYGWEGANTLSTKFEYNQKNSYLDVPLVFKQELNKNTLQAYYQVGVYYSYLQQSKKNIATFETESSLNNTETALQTEIISTKDNFIHSNAGVTAGFGVSYNLKNSQIGILTSVRYTLHNLSNTNNRYDNYRTLGKYYDINDNLKLLNWSVSLVYIGQSKAYFRSRLCPM